MSFHIAGSWKLKAWRRIDEDNGTVTYPLGENPSGLLIYTADFNMAVQMVAAHRPPIATDDALGGDAGERAAAYSTCLAYFGSYEVRNDVVTHRIDASLFPNWSGTVQSRPFSHDEKELVLRTPPAKGPGGTVVNEISWVRLNPEHS
jgi:hypothetical protein